MIRTGEFRTAALRIATIASVALLVAMPGTAAAQTAPAAPAAAAQDDPLKLSSNAPAMIVMQIHADKTADFESTWASIRAALAKSTKDDVKAFGESLTKLYKVDQPPTDIPAAAGAPAAKVMIYILQLDAPSTTISYHPFKLVWEQLWNADEKLSLVTRPEADTIFEKLKASFQNINPPWKLVKVG
jgi:hypothetical protein